MFSRRDFFIAGSSEFILSGMAAGNFTDCRSVQSKIDNLSRSGGGILSLGPCTVSVYKPIILRPGVSIEGSGSSTIFKAMVPSIKVFDAHGVRVEGRGGLSNLKVSAFGDQLSTRGTEADRAVVLGPFEYGWCRNVEISGSRWVSLTCKGIKFDVENCYIHHGFRDGIQMYDVNFASIINNIVDSVADDGISCMTSRGSNGDPYNVGQTQTTIKGNRISRCTGIKVLGRSNLLLEENIVDMVYGYGLFLGADLNFKEGLVPMNGLVVLNNKFTNIISLSSVSSQNGIAGLFFSGVNNGNVRGLKSIINSDIRISGNKLTAFSGDYKGKTPLWWVNGAEAAKDAKTASTISRIRGIYFKRGEYVSTDISDNYIEGFSNPIIFEEISADNSRISIKRNKFLDCQGGVVWNKVLS